ncbi:MAG: EAL domain-containing protein [Steroidobacteraceae bacterium]
MNAWRTPALSLHDSSGETLWLSEGSFGPDEHSVVLAALDVFALEPQRVCIHRKLEDGRRGLFLAARDPLGGCSGLVFAVIEGAVVDERRLVTPPLRSLLQRLSMLLAPPVDKRKATPASVNEPAEANALPDGAPIHARCYTRLQQGGGTRRYEISVTPANSNHDASVVERVVEWLTQHRQRYVAKPSTFAIAISPAAATDSQFAARLEQCLTRNEIDEGLVLLLLPAAAWQQQPERVKVLLAACERVHCHVMLDDFVLNETSLDLLRSKAVRMLKLNAELTTEAMESRYPRAILSACVQIARVLGIHCVAKRVVTATARNWLTNAGIDYIDPLSSSETDAAKTKGDSPFLRQVS